MKEEASRRATTAVGTRTTATRRVRSAALAIAVAGTMLSQTAWAGWGPGGLGRLFAATLVPLPLLVLQISLISLSAQLLQRVPSLAPWRYVGWVAATLSALVGLMIVSRAGAEHDHWPALYAIAVLAPPVVARLATSGTHGVYTLFFLPQLAVLGWYASYYHQIREFLVCLEPPCLIILTAHHAVVRRRHPALHRPMWPALVGLAASLPVLLWLTAYGAAWVGLPSPWEFDLLPWSTLIPSRFAPEFGLGDRDQYRLWADWLGLHIVWAGAVLLALASVRLGWLGQRPAAAHEARRADAQDGPTATTPAGTAPTPSAAHPPAPQAQGHPAAQDPS